MSCTGACVKGLNRGNLALLHRDVVGKVVEVKINVFFRPHDLFLEIVSKFFSLAGGLGGLVGKLLHDFADARITPAPDEAVGPDPNFAGAVPTQNGTILNQRHFATHARCGKGGPHAGVASANHDEVESFGDRLVWEAELSPSPIGQQTLCMRRKNFTFVREKYSVAPSIKAGQIVKGQLEFACCQLDSAPIVPEPFLTLGSEGFSQGCPVYFYLKSPGLPLGLPACHPVLGTNPNPIFSGNGDYRLSHGVFNRLTKPVCQEVG